MRKNTKSKYYTFMMALYDAKEFDVKALMREHKVSSRLVTLLRDNRLIARYGKVTKWVGDIPTQALANSLGKESLKIARISKMQNKTSQKQLTIKPLTRVASLVEPPVQPIELHDNAQLTWMHLALIFCAGILAGGLIATIWK